MNKPHLLRIFSPFKRQSGPIVLMGHKPQDASSTGTHLNDTTSKASSETLESKPSVRSHTHLLFWFPLIYYLLETENTIIFKTLKDSLLQGWLITPRPLPVLPGVS